MNLRWDTISLKVLAPSLAGVLAGLLVLIIGLAFADPGVRTVGLTILGAALAHAGIGYSTPNRTTRLGR